MTHLIHLSHMYGLHYDLFMRGLAEEEYRLGKNAVKILLCDSTVDICTSNARMERGVCMWCRAYRKALLARLPKEIEVLRYRDFYLPQNRAAVDSLRFDYASVRDIKGLTYKGAKIGYGAFSTYVTFTRNLYPEMDDNFRGYFDRYLKAGCILAEVFSNVMDKVRPDIVSLINGRHFETRPILDIAMGLGCATRCYESLRSGAPKNVNYIYAENAMIHGSEAICKLINGTWDGADLGSDEKQRIGNVFFENRRGALYSGDRVYVKGQKLGTMPAGFDESKRNIAIFTSSEDEFASIDTEYDDDQIFASQRQGVAEILEHFKDDTRFHFYLRIHPNLNGILYRYHTSLLELGDLYANVTVIRANDEISSYSLLDGVEKVLVFGSTLGVEAAYWGKPVILLCAAFYKYLNICYKPKSVEEAFSLIGADGLAAKDRADALKYGFYSMYDRNKDRKPNGFYPYTVFKIWREIMRIFKQTRLIKGIEIPVKEDSGCL